MSVASTVTIMYQKAITGCLLIAEGTGKDTIQFLCKLFFESLNSKTTHAIGFFFSFI